MDRKQDEKPIIYILFNGGFGPHQFFTTKVKVNNFRFHPKSLNSEPIVVGSLQFAMIHSKSKNYGMTGSWVLPCSSYSYIDRAGIGLVGY
ncbi:hypothetical protein N5J44_13850 [Acinetobacter ursingii]|uniref:Uncharacterized protein n=1 Tax=Acinetobacter ursingii TaxID=108980 RepID=A0AA46NS44_9GAMM|nr:hypothetical protein [Acinetobacter ursingii]MCU4603461.1 hypothetical protein [Acinetobacter ursingii]MDH2020290.1 hypothetical protein [Acinetobacter ursingii]MDH2072610.1 hypothetical protein [Acinetobacter ursingii]UYF76495.1 hypothetical protein LSO58_06365 [Acinetobacter ursingii]